MPKNNAGDGFAEMESCMKEIKDNTDHFVREIYKNSLNDLARAKEEDIEVYGLPCLARHTLK